MENLSLAVEARGVRKSFGDHLVLDGIELEVGEGTVFALLGPNGSGKTTAVRILSTLLAADAGVVRVAGHDVAREPDRARAAIGVTGQFSSVDKLLTGRENLMLMADLAHLDKATGRRWAAELLDRFDLGQAADKTPGHLLRWNAPPPRPGHDPRRPSPGHLPRRAHYRARPPRPPCRVGDGTQPGRRRRCHDPVDHPVPRRSRPPRPPGWRRGAYANYVTPAIILLAVASASTATAISVATDMTEGIIDRFRTMAIARGAVLTGHVIGSMIQTVIGVAIVLGVALALGYRPTAGPLAWLATAGVLALFTFALVWLSAALGLAAKSVETASNTPLFLTLLPLLSSGFVPTGTMPPGLRQFAEYQPFTPVTQTVRGLLTGTPIGTYAIAAVAWSAGIALVCYLWAVRLYNRRRAAEPK